MLEDLTCNNKIQRIGIPARRIGYIEEGLSIVEGVDEIEFVGEDIRIPGIIAKPYPPDFLSDGKFCEQKASPKPIH